jgi:hypothetical protein
VVEDDWGRELLLLLLKAARTLLLVDLALPAAAGGGPDTFCSCWGPLLAAATALVRLLVVTEEVPAVLLLALDGADMGTEEECGNRSSGLISASMQASSLACRDSSGHGRGEQVRQHAPSLCFATFTLHYLLCHSAGQQTKQRWKLHVQKQLQN